MNETVSDCLVVWEDGDPGSTWAHDDVAGDAGDAGAASSPLVVRHERLGAVAPGDGSFGDRRNQVLDSASERYVCFVSTPARASRADVADGVELLESHPRVSAVAVGEGPESSEQVTFFGLSWQAHGGPRRSVLAPVGATVVVRNDRRPQAPRYDGELGRRGAELEFGWKIWLAGGRIEDLRRRTSAGSTAGGTDQIALEDVADAVTVAWRCLDDGRSTAALAGGLLVAPMMVQTGEADRLLARVTDGIGRSGPHRAAIQATRCRRDAEILHLFGDPLDVPGVAAPSLAPFVRELHLGELFGSRRRVLVVTGDVIGPGMAGPAIRAWNMAECLAGEHDVVLATTTGRASGEGAGFRIVAPEVAGFEELMEWCEIVVVQGFVLLHVPALRRPDRVMVADVYDILHLEALELSRRAPGGPRHDAVSIALRMLNEQAVRGDFFICASEKQRDYWIGHLSAVGRVNVETYTGDPVLRSLVDVVPFGLPGRRAERTGPGPRTAIAGVGPGDDVLLWAGGVYDWLDPVTLIRAVDRLRDRRPQVRLVFMGMQHPNPEVPSMAMAARARRVAASLGIEGKHVFFNDGWVDYRYRQNWLLDADIGVSTHFEHAETAFAFRTRLLDYLWTGLPVVATAGDAFAQLIEDEGLGRVVGTQDVAGLEAALYELLSDPDITARCRQNVERVRHRFEWSTTLEPLLRFCREPARAPDRSVAPAEGRVGGTMARLLRRSRSAAALYAEGGTQAVLAVASQRLRGGRGGPALREGAVSPPA